MAAQQKKCEQHVKEIRQLSWEIENRQTVLQDYERLQQIIPQAQKQYDQMREEAEKGSWTILTLQGKIQSLQTSASDQSQIDDSGLREQLETKERELIATKKGAELLQQKLAETGADRDRAIASLKRTESQLKYGQGVVSDMATRHHSELLQETTEVNRLRDEVKTVTDELAASKGALSTKAIVRVQGEVQSDQERQIKELTARVNELAGAPKGTSARSAVSRASSAATSECESSEWSEWQEDYDYCYEEAEEEEEAQPDEEVPDEGPDASKDKSTVVKTTKDEGDGGVKRTTITIKHPQSVSTPSRKIIYSTTLLLSTKKGDSVIDCKDTTQMRIGHILMIGDHFYEERRVLGFGSVFLDSPLTTAHEAGEAVMVVEATPAVPPLNLHGVGDDGGASAADTTQILISETKADDDGGRQRLSYRRYQSVRRNCVSSI